MPAQAARLDQAVRLADGRVLGYAEYGTAAGPPLLIFHGLPGSRLAIPDLWPGSPLRSGSSLPTGRGWGRPRSSRAGA